MKIDIKKLQEFESRISGLFNVSSVVNPEWLSNGVEIARQYYTFLDENKEPYGSAALQVVNNSGFFGRVANIHLKTQAIFDGMNPKDFDSVRSNIVIILAMHDVSKRIEHDGELGYDAITEYHIKAFRTCNLPPYAWGGLAVEELIGPGKWMTLHDKDMQGFQDMVSNIIKYVSPRAEYSVVTCNGYAVERMITSIEHSVACALSHERPYAPISKELDPTIVAIKYDVDISRIECIVNEPEILVWGEPSMDSSPPVKTYKVLPRKDSGLSYVSLLDDNGNKIEDLGSPLFGIISVNASLQEQLRDQVSRQTQEKISGFIGRMTGLALGEETNSTPQDEMSRLFPDLSLEDRKFAEDLASNAQNILSRLLSGDHTLHPDLDLD
ncbi:MAG: hypothetical protein RLZZ59_17 [Pseudomonadota bacterium]|jgi:hypothetical protein